MVSWAVAIPSHARAATLAVKTLPLLRARGVEAVEVWVAADEFATYEATLTEWGHGDFAVLRVGEPTLAGNRAALQSIERPWADWLIQVDDDMDDFIVRTGEQTSEPIVDLRAFFDEACAIAEAQAVVLWGMYPVPNPYFMRDRVRLDLCYIGGGCFGLHRSALDLVPSMEDKEDYERSVLGFERSGAVARLEWASWRTKVYTEPGGMQTTRTPERVEACARAVVDRWPDLARYKVSRSRGMPEVVLRSGPTQSIPRP